MAHVYEGSRSFSRHPRLNGMSHIVAVYFPTTEHCCTLIGTHLLYSFLVPSKPKRVSPTYTRLKVRAGSIVGSCVVCMCVASSL